MASRSINEIANKNPAGLNFTLKLKDGKTIRVGEKIRLELSFATSAPDAYVYENANYDRSGRLEIDTFVDDQTTAVNDPLFDYFHGSRLARIGWTARNRHVEPRQNPVSHLRSQSVAAF